MKKEKVYSREYVFEKLSDDVSLDLHHHLDNINKELEKRFISLNNASFLAYQENSLVYISLTKENKSQGDRKAYTRKIRITLTPPSEMPKELSDLLDKEGFKKLE